MSEQVGYERLQGGVRIVLCGLLLAAAAGCSSAYMKGTPLYTGDYSVPQAPPEDRVNLWPLLYYHSPALSVFWPIGEVTDDHVAVRPLASVYKLDKERHQYNILWPLAEFDFDSADHRIFPLFWGGSGSRGYFVLFPLLFTKWPAGEFSDVESAVLFPLFWYLEHRHVALFPLAMHFNCKPGHSTHLLWPIFKFKKTDDETDWRIWPVVGQRKDGAAYYQFLFWPMFHRWGDDTLGEKRRLILPLYFSKRGKVGGVDILLPLFGRSYSPGSSTFLSLIYSAARHGGDYWRLVFPFWYQDRRADKGRFITPMVGRSWSGEYDTWSVIPLISWFARSGNERDLWLLGPLAHFGYGASGKESHVFPLYYYNGAKDVFISPLFGGSVSEDDGFVTLLGPLFMYFWEADDSWLWFAPFPLVGAYDDITDRGSWVWPLYTYRGSDLDDEEHRGTALWPLLHYGFGPERRRLMLFPVFRYCRDDTARYEEAGIEHASREKSFYCLPSFWYRRSMRSERPLSGASGGVVAQRKCSGLWPLWRHEVDSTADGVEKKFSILGRLYDYRESLTHEEGEETETHVRSRVLWRMVHYEREDEQETLDLFPFVTYDRDRATGFRKFSFAWRLVRYERGHDGSLKLDLLFIPVRRPAGR